MDPVSGQQRRRTDYAGTIWFGGRPQMVGEHPLPGRNAQITTPLWLPDSHRYDAAAAKLAWDRTVAFFNKYVR